MMTWRLTPDEYRCYPWPLCPDRHECSRYTNSGAVGAMNAMPYRKDGLDCEWFLKKVEEKR